MSLTSPLEQKKIAACIQSIDALIEAESKKVQLLQQLKKGLTQQLFPKPGETLARLRFPEFQTVSP